MFRQPRHSTRAQNRVDAYAQAPTNRARGAVCAFSVGARHLGVGSLGLSSIVAPCQKRSRACLGGNAFLCDLYWTHPLLILPS